ncbi:hypothetical protein D3C85_1615160 [compost metagenome]
MPCGSGTAERRLLQRRQRSQHIRQAARVGKAQHEILPVRIHDAPGAQAFEQRFERFVRADEAEHRQAIRQLQHTTEQGPLDGIDVQQNR